MDALIGTWAYVRDENSDAVMKDILGLPDDVVTTMKSAQHILEKDGDSYVWITVIGGEQTNTIKFKLGEEFEGEDQGIKFKSKMDWKDGKLFSEDFAMGKKIKTIRSIDNGQMISEAEVEGKTMKTWFNKVK